MTKLNFQIELKSNVAKGEIAPFENLIFATVFFKICLLQRCLYVGKGFSEQLYEFCIYNQDCTMHKL